MRSTMLDTWAFTYTRWRGHIALAASIGCGAWAVIFIRLAQQEHVPSLLIASFRLVAASLILAPFVLRRYHAHIRKLSRADWLHILVAGALLGALLVAASFSLEHTTVLIVAVLFATTPLWIALLELIFLKADFNQSTWLGLACALVGSIIIAVSGNSANGLGRNPVLGISLALAGALIASLYAIIGRKVRKRIPLLPYMWLIFIVGGALDSALLLATHTNVAGQTPTGYLWLALATLIPQIGSHVSYNYALRHLPATYCSIFGQLEVILSATIAFLIFGEIPGALQLPGTIAVIVGVTLINLNQPQTD